MINGNYNDDLACANTLLELASRLMERIICHDNWALCGRPLRVELLADFL